MHGLMRNVDNIKCFSCLNVEHQKYMILYGIWYHLYNLKYVKNTHGGVQLLVKLQAKAVSVTKTL